MDMSGLVLGANPSLTLRRSDIVVLVNDGRSGCCEFLHAVCGGHRGCMNGYVLHHEQVPHVNWFFVNDVQEKQRRRLDWLSINGNWYWGSFAKEYVTESCNGVKFVRGRLLNARDSGCKVSGGGMIRSVGVMMGTAMAWCLKQNVSVRHLPPVPSMMAQMQR
jgi:hypothetical protein